MKASILLEMIGDTDDSIIEEAKKREKPVAERLARWIAVAACLCLIVAAIVGILKLINKTPSDTLEHRISEYGIGSKTIMNPVFVSHSDMPKTSENDILNCIKNNITVQGTLSSMDTVRIDDNDSVWFITTAVISVDEVITGKYDADKVHFVCAACYIGGPIDENNVPIPHLAGCQENTYGVFVLHGLDGGSWTICGKEVSPKSLGDYYVVCYLERSGDVLTYREQNISVSVNDIVR